MKVLLLVLAVTALAHGDDHTTLRVTWGLSALSADRSAFFKLPTDLAAAQNDGWLQVPGSDKTLPELRLACPADDMTVCLMFDDTGYVAGIQIAFAVDDFTTAPDYYPEKKFVKWTAPATKSQPARDYWTVTQHFVSRETLSSGSRDPSKGLLQDGGVWVTGPDGNLMKISTKEEDIAATDYKKQNCIPNMGTHYFYNSTKEQSCDSNFSWFALTKSGNLVATGVHIIGTLKNQPKWWENPPASKFGLSFIVPRAPDCLFDWTGKYGVFTLHVYYLDKPWRTQCLNLLLYQVWYKAAVIQPLYGINGVTAPIIIPPQKDTVAVLVFQRSHIFSRHGDVSCPDEC